MALTDKDLNRGNIVINKRTGKRVAITGSNPSQVHFFTEGKTPDGKPEFGTMSRTRFKVEHLPMIVLGVLVLVVAWVWVTL